MKQQFVILADNFKFPKGELFSQNYRLGKQEIVIVEEDPTSDLINKLAKVNLERIFTKDQSIYPFDTALKNTKTPKNRFVFHLALQENKDLLKSYKEIHSKGAVWPQILENMDTVGVIDMDIYLNNFDAFMIMDTKPDFNENEANLIWPKLPKEAEWQAFVSKYQKTNSDASASEKWQKMTLIS